MDEIIDFGERSGNGESGERRAESGAGTASGEWCGTVKLGRGKLAACRHRMNARQANAGTS